MLKFLFCLFSTLLIGAGSNGAVYEKNAGTIRFHDRNDYPQYYFLSNFYPYQGKARKPDITFYIDGANWPSTEHYFQAQKHKGKKTYSDFLKKELTAFDAWKKGGKGPSSWSNHDSDLWNEVKKYVDESAISSGERKDWERLKTLVMCKAVWAKFNGNKILGKKLLATGDAYLLEDDAGAHKGQWESFWGNGKSASGSEGKNMLGKILMHVRKRLKEKYGSTGGKQQKQELTVGGYQEVLDYLMSRNILNFSVKANASEWKQMIKALEDGDLETVKKLFNKFGSSLAKTKGKKPRTLLEIAQYHLEKHKPKQKKSTLVTALHNLKEKLEELASSLSGMKKKFKDAKKSKAYTSLAAFVNDDNPHQPSDKTNVTHQWGQVSEAQAIVIDFEAYHDQENDNSGDVSFFIKYGDLTNDDGTSLTQSKKNEIRDYLKNKNIVHGDDTFRLANSNQEVLTGKNNPAWRYVHRYLRNLSWLKKYTKK